VTPLEHHADDAAVRVGYHAHVENQAGTTHAGIVLAAGSGTRVGNSRNKVYLPLAGRRIVTWSLASAAWSWLCVTTIRNWPRRFWTASFPVCRSIW
jgi:hypothetical protein